MVAEAAEKAVVGKVQHEIQQDVDAENDTGVETLAEAVGSEAENEDRKNADKPVLGGSWAPFGRDLERFGAHLGRSWASPGRFGGCWNRILSEPWPKLVSKRRGGWILGGFGRGFGKVWRGFGRVWGGLGRFSKLISCACSMSPAAPHFVTGTPALPSFASRSVTIRGGSVPLTRVEF